MIQVLIYHNISYYSSANSRGAPDGIFLKNLQTAKKKWLRFPPSSRVSQLSKPVDPWNTSELDHWSRGANFLSSFGTCCCFECSGPSTWPKKAERSGEKLGDACLWFENGHPKLFNFQQMVENAWKSTSWRLIDHSCGYCPWYLSKANKNRPVAPLNGVDSGARLCRNPIFVVIVISSRIVILVLIQRIYIYI